LIDPYLVVGPLLRALDPERAHGLAIRALRHGLVPRMASVADPILRTSVWGRDFPNPIGLAAGFDKNAEVPDAMLGLGFGFVEIGSVTPRAQPGNPKPRMFRLSEDQGVINRLGFNCEGLAAAVPRLAARAQVGIVGANLGKNKDTVDAVADYETGAAALGRYCDYLVCNVSSPNTPGLRALQGKEPLQELISRVQRMLATLPQPPPLVLKIAPDITEDDKRDIADVALDSGIAGLIVGNTTITRPATLRSRHREETGGLSGRPLFTLSTQVLADMYTATGGRLPLVGAGGIASGADAYAKIRAGASLVQLYSALVYQGPALIGRIARDLAALLRRDGFARVADAVGADHR
jgi:dihydroorotate dehydrogenase